MSNIPDRQFRTQLFIGNTQGTRMCLDPWSLLLIKANGDVLPCCHSKPIGSIENQSMEEIINSQELEAYKIGLFTGKLTVSCQYCPARRKCTTEELHAALDKYQKTGEKP